jgi:hypothetical protein
VTRLHLLTCVWCTRYGKQIAYVNQAMRFRAEAIEQEALAEQGLSPKVRTRVKRAIEDNLG